MKHKEWNWRSQFINEIRSRQKKKKLVSVCLCIFLFRFTFCRSCCQWCFSASGTLPFNMSFIELVVFGPSHLRALYSLGAWSSFDSFIWTAPFIGDSVNTAWTIPISAYEIQSIISSQTRVEGLDSGKPCITSIVPVMIYVNLWQGLTISQDVDSKSMCRIRGSGWFLRINLKLPASFRLGPVLVASPIGDVC